MGGRKTERLEPRCRGRRVNLCKVGNHVPAGFLEARTSTGHSVQLRLFLRRFAALDPVAQGLRRRYGSVEADTGRGLALRMDHGSQYLSDHFLNQVRYWGIRPSFGLLEEPETNGVVERWNRTLKEQAVYGRVFQNLADVRAAVAEVPPIYRRERVPRPPNAPRLVLRPRPRSSRHRAAARADGASPPRGPAAARVLRGRSSSPPYACRDPRRPRTWSSSSARRGQLRVARARRRDRGVLGSQRRGGMRWSISKFRNGNVIRQPPQWPSCLASNRTAILKVH